MTGVVELLACTSRDACGVRGMNPAVGNKRGWASSDGIWVSVCEKSVVCFNLPLCMLLFCVAEAKKWVHLCKVCVGVCERWQWWWVHEECLFQWSWVLRWRCLIYFVSNMLFDKNGYAIVAFVCSVECVCVVVEYFYYSWMFEWVWVNEYAFGVALSVLLQSSSRTLQNTSS